MLFQFPEHVKVEGRQIGIVRLISFPKMLSLCNHLQIDGTISRWLDVILRMVHILSIFNNESLYSWGILSTKNVLSCLLQLWSKFPVDVPFPFRSTPQRLSPPEWNYYDWKPWNWTIVCVSFGLISQCCLPWRQHWGTSVIYFLNAQCIFIILKSLIWKLIKSFRGQNKEMKTSSQLKFP